jgi:hypothetical protein
MNQKRVISFQVERSTTEQLAELARRADRSLSAEIRRAVREHIDHQLPARSPPLTPELDERRGQVGRPAAARGEEDA